MATTEIALLEQCVIDFGQRSFDEAQVGKVRHQSS